MFTSKIVWKILAGLTLAGAAAGCGSGNDQGQSSLGQTGTLSVALTGSAGSSNSGVTYHLTNAVFEVTNPFSRPPVDIVTPGDDPTLQVDLAPSGFAFDYQISLHDGWTLNLVNADGTEQPVSATLLTDFIPFTIKPQRTTPVVFQFKAGDQVITTGNGSVGVSIAVDDTLIDDFEDGDGLLAPIGGRNGGWFTFNDGTGTQIPAPSAGLVKPEVVDTSANYLLHTTGSGFAPLGSPLQNGLFTFGAGVGTNLVVDPAATGDFRAIPYDASRYSGIQFTFSTQASPSIPQQVSFLVATTATTPPELGGTCTTGCFDDFGFIGFVPPGDFTFTGGFDWSDLQQQGFGTPVAFDPTTILTVKWIVGFENVGQSASSDIFDFRLDDVSFRTSSGASVSSRSSGPIDGKGAAGAGAGGVPNEQPLRRLWPAK